MLVGLGVGEALVAESAWMVHSSRPAGIKIRHGSTKIGPAYDAATWVTISGSGNSSGYSCTAPQVEMGPSK